jgi:hypothetical protein
MGVRCVRVSRARTSLVITCANAGVMPLYWQEDRVVISADQAQQFQSGYNLAFTMRTLAFVAAPVCGCVSLLSRSMTCTPRLSSVAA